MDEFLSIIQQEKAIRHALHLLTSAGQRPIWNDRLGGVGAMDRFRIRPARKDDARLLFEWRNDESTRNMSRNKDVIAWDDHVAWLDRRLGLAQPNLFIFELDEKPVATFRIDGEDVSYAVAPEHRNRGIARLMLNEVRARFGCLRAHVYADNELSIRVARSAGLDVVIIDV
ncbi:GNAT family N-acetyltransferase [Bradyrhizobium lablabi]|uniref:GNAT family N-acetyltransferase n=1 Tax=Bradyrhizobium lablabi TaxID=722472 RepID=UPI001BAADD39|nr:GNAT family N-acetyltransferase [Bradyrhizobium lablabi]MBR0694883.1 GNAT family N-acetyltransferase [Bradyrhizobium lablabi]